MFLKITKVGQYSYAQIVHAYRDEDGKARQKIILSLGRIDTAGGLVDNIINGIQQAREASSMKKTPEGGAHVTE